MYYIEAYLNAWLIRKAHEVAFIFGPFNNEGDASFVCEMMNNDKIQVKAGTSYGEERTKESHTVYKYSH